MNAGGEVLPERIFIAHRSVKRGQRVAASSQCARLKSDFAIIIITLTLSAGMSGLAGQTGENICGHSAFQGGDGEPGFQIYVAPIDTDQISQERFLRDAPSGVRRDPVDITVDGTHATSFHGFDARMGQTYEIWFIREHFLYEVSTYKQTRTVAERNYVHLAIYLKIPLFASPLAGQVS